MSRSTRVLLVLFALLLAMFALKGIYRENMVRSSPVEKVLVTAMVPPTSALQDRTKRIDFAPEPIEVNPSELTTKSTLFVYGQPLALIFDLGNGYSVQTNWGVPVLYRSDVPTVESMAFETGGMETRVSTDGTLVTLVHSGYYLDNKLFATDLVNYVSLNGHGGRNSTVEAQEKAQSLLGDTVWLCQATDGSVKPLDALDPAQGCPNLVQLRISAIAIIRHELVAAYEHNMPSLRAWMAEYEKGNGGYSFGFDKLPSGTWVITTCLEQFNDQASDGSHSYEFNRLVLALEEVK